jgi:hypothetical protein|tara:strand:+ start:1613 stop:1798 length:186 start_codon:yes stop_codon:yes gene_type:complete
MSEISKKIVDQIESGKLNDAKDSINQGIKQKAADAVDMKRVEMSVDWANGENLGTDNIDSE